MAEKNVFRLSVNVQIANSEWASGGLSIRDEFFIATVTFAEAAEILEAFHTLCQKYAIGKEGK
jgi:hypothetical protein